MRSPIGDGALRGLVPSGLRVAERRLSPRAKGRVLAVGLTAVLGGPGGD